MGLKETLTGGRGRGWEHERASKRLELAIPVQLKIGSDAPEARRLRDVSLNGAFVAGPCEGAELGEPAILRFEGYPEVCPAFALFGHVCRIEPTGVAIEIDRGQSDKETLDRFRTLVLHYLRHRPILNELAPRFYEGRCRECGWIGRVAGRAPTCARCGGKVGPVRTS